MHIFHLFSFAIFMHVSVWCIEETITETEEFRQLFSATFVKQLNTTIKEPIKFFSMLKGLSSMCQCAHDQLKKTHTELTKFNTTEAVMMKSLLEGLMKKVPETKVTRNGCKFKMMGAPNVSNYFTKFFEEFIARNCATKA